MPTLPEFAFAARALSGFRRGGGFSTATFKSEEDT